MNDVLEMLCESCRTIHPRKPNTSLIQSCPSCGAVMVPTSDNLREIASLRRALDKAYIKVDELKVELNNKHDALFNACCESEALREELAAIKAQPAQEPTVEFKDSSWAEDAEWAAPQPTAEVERDAALDDAVRYLHKWLNEESTASIDRVMLAKVLAAIQKGGVA